MNSAIKALQTLAPRSTETFNCYISILQQCAIDGTLREARRVHVHMKMSGFPYLSLGNKLVDTYLKCGAVDDARKVFDEMPQPHIVSWNSMISSYIRCRRSQEAVDMYHRMVLEGVVADDFTFSSVFRAFSDLGYVEEGRRAHGRLVVNGLGADNVFVGSALVDMYAKFGQMSEARAVYDRFSEKDVVLVTALIVGYTQNGEDHQAVQLFVDMVNGGVRANEFTFASVLIASGNLTELRNGMTIHGLIFKTGFESRNASQTSLFSMYSKCGLVDESLTIFSGIANPNTVTWTAIIGCLACHHREEFALSMFREMLRNSVSSNAFTLSTVLRGCSALALFEQGRLIHCTAVKIGLDRDRYVSAALIDTYGKCGRVGMARVVFDNLPGIDLVSMNSMIYGYAQNGYGLEAVELFNMTLQSGLEPNDATFISVLSACSNAGLLEEGRRIFSSIINDHGLVPSTDQYACMINLLGRAGKLEEAKELITKIKNPDKVLWRTLLSSCKIHGEIEMAKKAAARVLELAPGDEGTHVLLSNIYASVGKWDEVINMKCTMREMKLKKDPAMSWTEVNRETHTFMAGDRSHPKAEEIYKELERLIERTKVLGYVPNTRFVLQEMDELQKEQSLYYHSEKLAIAFGVLSSSDKGNTTISIFKNLRVCEIDGGFSINLY
ncbi:hypothetical protein J5N97_006830 [Dioscorea zingiberensis]|uniref:DYW domain-containing protein n=1 Tax=Dioscorea zingiberensis TaxID=325984 RepID=A0A9D5HTM5_9LILI|nr:hypothetical protein J5N97_006830 [Dioscorea zingiberensis]